MTIVKPTIQAAFYQDAGKVFKAAQEARPVRRGTPVAQGRGDVRGRAARGARARRGARGRHQRRLLAYKQVGEYGKAIGMYDKFISEYGSDERLTALQKGSAKEHRPGPEEVRGRASSSSARRTTRSRTTYYGFFNYQKAAETFEKIGRTRASTKPSARTPRATRCSSTRAWGSATRRRATTTRSSACTRRPTRRPTRTTSSRTTTTSNGTRRSRTTGRTATRGSAAEAALERFYGANRGQPRGLQVLAAGSVLGLQDEEDRRTTRATARRRRPPSRHGSFHAQRARKDGKARGHDGSVRGLRRGGAVLAHLRRDPPEYDIETGHHKYAGTVPDIIGSANAAGVVTPGRYQKDAATRRSTTSSWMRSRRPTRRKSGFPRPSPGRALSTTRSARGSTTPSRPR